MKSPDGQRGNHGWNAHILRLKKMISDVTKKVYIERLKGMKQLSLTEDNINTIVEEIKTFMISKKVAGRDVVKLGLLIEEVLLRFMERFGKEQTVFVDISKFANTKILIKLKGEQYNPFLEDEDDVILGSEFLNNLLNTDGTLTTYQYRNGYNEIIALARKEHKNLKIPGGAVTIAVILAFVAALLTTLLPGETTSFLVNDLAAPLLSRLLDLIVLVMGPLIFISVISGICALDDVVTLSTIGIKAIKRFVVITLLLITASVIVSMLFFPGFSMTSNGRFDLSSMINMLLDLIPKDLVSPFVENKTIQLIIIASLIGVALLILDQKTAKLRSIVSESNQLVFTVMGFVSKVIPLTVFLSIYKTVSINNFSDILNVWKLVASGYVIMVPFTVCMVLYVCLRRKLKIRKFLKDISGPAIVGLTTGSGTLAMTKQFETARNVMKKDEKLVEFWVPLSHAMFSPSVIPPLVAAAFYAGSYYGTPISIMQILILYILVTQLSVASPKVPGGIMATYTILLGQLGMPTDVVGLLMIANVFVVNAETGLAMIIRSTELEEFSHVIKTHSSTQK